MAKQPKLPPAPKSLTCESAALWGKILSDWPISDAAHLRVLQAGLESLDRAESCRQRITVDGEIQIDRFGQSKPHCLLAAERDSRAAFVHAIRALGLDPSEAV